MRYEIYDKKSSLTLPDGTTATAEELSANNQYAMLFKTDCIIGVEAGIMHSFYPLSNAKEAFNITEPDPEKALALVIEAQKAAEEAAKKEAVTIEDLQAQIADQQAALLELGDMIGGE